VQETAESPAFGDLKCTGFSGNGKVKYRVMLLFSAQPVNAK
jgi:hypothetical protein